MNLLFDLDGTLSDPFEGISSCINYALAKLGREERDPRSLAKFIGPPLMLGFSELLDTKDEGQLNEAIRLYRERYDSIGYRENTLYPKVEELLTDLATSSCRQFIATSKSTYIAQRVIENFNLNSYFKRVYGSEDGQSKIDLLARILETESLGKADTVMIGDRSFDVLAGKKNGLRTIGVLWGYGSEQELKDAGADDIVSTIAELRRAVGI